MKTLNHPNLVKMLGVCIEKSPFYLVQVRADTYSKLEKNKRFKNEHISSCYNKKNNKYEIGKNKSFKNEHISICRSCAAMEICGTIWKLLNLWRHWVRWVKRCPWGWRSELIWRILLNCDFSEKKNYNISGREKQREVWECAKVSKADQLVHGYHKRFTF